MPLPDVSIIVPCYNEAENIVPLVEAVEKVFLQTSYKLAWEIIFVDDHSPDHTIDRIRALAAFNPRVRGLLRLGRRGLSSAVIEGALSASAPVIAVMDGDLQHDEACLPDMVAAIMAGQCDLVVASRYVEGGENAGLANGWRRFLSKSGIWAARHILSVPLSDPMSGFFAIRRQCFEDRVSVLKGKGFKILLDLVMARPEPLRTLEVPMIFRERTRGESKLGSDAIFSYGCLLLYKFSKKHGKILAVLGIMALMIAGSLLLPHNKKRDIASFRTK